jgi:hypothetical protein
MKTVWVLVVLVLADGEWRTWDKEYITLDACEEIKHLITYHRETQIIAQCVPIIKN